MREEPPRSASAEAAPRRLRVLRPLRHRDFALLWTGQSISLIGDGIYLVAIAWQVYDLSNAPAALALVGVGWSLPFVALVLAGGVASDRFDRRRVMLFSDVVRGLAVLAIGVLSVTGSVRLWHVVVLVVVYGAGEAFFGPANGAIVPDLVSDAELVQANALDQFVRPFAARLAGPALGGVLIGALGIGAAFLVDAGTFAASAVALAAMRARPGRREPKSAGGSRAQVARGLSFVRGEVWLWATLGCAALALLVSYGPMEVLVPYIVKHSLGGGAATLGVVFAAGGLASILAALIMGRGELPRRHITVMYSCWAVGSFAIVGYGFAHHAWELVLVTAVLQGTFTAGMVIWGTLVHRVVPAELLGRVTSLDWFVSVSLVPVSFALTGPIAAAIGVRMTLVGAGVLGGAAALGFLFIPGLREIERRPLARVCAPPSNLSDSIPLQRSIELTHRT